MVTCAHLEHSRLQFVASINTKTRWLQLIVKHALMDTFLGKDTNFVSQFHLVLRETQSRLQLNFLRCVTKGPTAIGDLHHAKLAQTVTFVRKEESLVHTTDVQKEAIVLRVNNTNALQVNTV